MDIYYTVLGSKKKYYKFFIKTHLFQKPFFNKFINELYAIHYLILIT